MNKQQTKTSRGIEWTDYTWNAIAGCKHRCRWTMPDGTVAICYAEEIANKFTATYPNGFEHHYFHPHRLNEPLKEKKPAKIFLDSMSDLMGAWTPKEQVEEVLSIVRQAHWHSFQLLTKNAPKLLEFDLPPNLWVGVSSPPDSMFGKSLNRQQQERMLAKSLDVLSRVNTPVRWMSFEPLSWDVSGIVKDHAPLQWAVIGAASNGPRHYQPDPAHVQALLDVLNSQNVPVFFKGNLKWSPWREEFPHAPAAFPCPICKQEMDSYLNVGRHQFGVCQHDQVYFWLGENLFSSWKMEPPEKWEENRAHLNEFRFVGRSPIGMDDVLSRIDFSDLLDLWQKVNE